MELVVGVFLIISSIYGVTLFTRELKNYEGLVVVAGFTYGCGAVMFLCGCLFVVEFLWEMMR